MPSKRKQYTAKRNEVTGTWNVFDPKGTMETRIGCGFDRSTARKFAFLLTTGRMVVEKRNPLDMPHSGTPGHILGKQLQAKQDEERENFQKNKFAIMAGMREAERLEASPFNEKGK